MNSSDTLQVTSLSSILTNLGENDTFKLLNGFVAVHDSATESFLHSKAIEMEKRDLSRTYLILSSNTQNILGYVTVGVKCMLLSYDNMLSGKVKSKLNVEASTGIMQSYLLGQLSRSIDAPKGLGTVLLDLAFGKLEIARSAVGCRTVRLDCHDELVPYYENYGFKLIRKNNEKSLNQMIASIPNKAFKMT